MLALLLLFAGVSFFWMPLKALATREIQVRTQVYRRDSEPVMYWMSVLSYLVIAVWTSVYAVLAELWRRF